MYCALCSVHKVEGKRGLFVFCVSGLVKGWGGEGGSEVFVWGENWG